ncbi:MAG: hypothetical protein ABIZ52_00190 [Candidatus Limnocylindrales bacterium]
MPSNAVPGFLPSRYGFRFRNFWPSGPARTINLGIVKIPIGDTGRGLCGGMAFAARDRFVRGEDAPADLAPPKQGTALFKEIVDRQFASFGSFFSVPIRFWRASSGSQAGRDRETVRDAWPAIKRAIDMGEPAMVGLVRLSGWNPLALRLGHQVVAYRYDETSARTEIGIYDPNHPGLDDVSITIERSADGAYRMAQSTDEPLIGLLALPFQSAR